MNQKSNNNLHGLEKYIEEVQKARFFQGKEVGGSFAQARDFHLKRAAFRRTAFRRWGMLVVILSAILPVAAAFSDALPGRTLLVSLMAAVIAILTSANSFFHWDTGWQGSTAVQMGIDQLYDNWQIAIADARTNPNDSDGLEQARKATQEFVAATHELMEGEAREYLSRQRFPEAQK